MAHKIEHFRENKIYQQKTFNIARCPTFHCIKDTEKDCIDWCNASVIDDARLCHYKCREMVKDKVESMIYQYSIFGDAIYKSFIV